MKLSEEEINRIKNKFEGLQNLTDLLALLNDTNVLLYGKNSKRIQMRQLVYYSNSKLCKNRYRTFTIKKKSGKERIINAPVSTLRFILSTLNVILQCVAQPNNAATGFVPGKSIVDSATPHINQYYVYNIDLKDFFHSFDRNRVKMAFIGKPFGLSKQKEPLAFFLSGLCTHTFEIDKKMCHVLPQGSPTSPTLTNIMCIKLDRRLSGLSKRFGVKYTRYADDITFSSMCSVFKKSEFLNELHRIIDEDNKLIFTNKSIELGRPLVVNESKTRLQKGAYKQEVTGLIVNRKVNVKRSYVKQIRMWIYYWEKYGLEKAERIFKRDYANDKGHVKKGEPSLVNVLAGKLDYLKMVKGHDDSTYLKLYSRYENLVSKSYPIEQILKIWEKEGVNEAMNLFYERYPRFIGTSVDKSKSRLKNYNQLFESSLLSSDKAYIVENSDTLFSELGSKVNHSVETIDKSKILTL